MSIRRLIPNLFTAGNLVCGVLAIIMILNGNIDKAPFLILIGALFDFIDGFVARLLKVSSDYGKYLDSLADMITFGVAPGLIVYELIRNHFFLDALYTRFRENPWEEPFPVKNMDSVCEYYINASQGPLGENVNKLCCEDPQFLYAPYIGLMLTVFAGFRLAKFMSSPESTEFRGLPTPAMTIFFASFPLIISNQSWASAKQSFNWNFDVLTSPEMLFVFTLLFSILMVAPLKMFSLKFKSFGWKGNEIRYIFLTISAILLATLFWWALPIIILLYVILSLIDNILNKSVKDEIQS